MLVSGHAEEVDELGTHSAILPPRPHPSPALTELTVQWSNCVVNNQILMQPRRERVLQCETLLSPTAPACQQPLLSFIAQDRNRASLTRWVKAPCFEK